LIKRNHIHILDVVAVLFFSLLASFIFGLKINFEQPVNYLELSRLIVLSIATFLFYLTVDKIKRMEHEAIEEFNNESNIQKKATLSIEMRYEKHLKKESCSILFKLYLSILLILIFLFMKPLIGFMSQLASPS